MGAVVQTAMVSAIGLRQIHTRGCVRPKVRHKKNQRNEQNDLPPNGEEDGFRRLLQRHKAVLTRDLQTVDEQCGEINAHLQYGALRRNDLLHFDAWASTFGETVTAIELSPEGYTLIGR